MIMELEDVNEIATNTSSVAEMKSTWNGIWKLQVPNQIRLLVWRVGSPTRVNLVRRKLLIDSICPQCKKGPEDTLHALWTCPLLSTVWQVVFSDLVAVSRSCSSFLNVV